MPASGVGHFAALVGPRGAWLVDYAAETGGLRVTGTTTEAGPFDTIDAGVAALRRLIDARQLRRAHVAVTINGFGALHHTVLLPAASDDVLEPLVRRDVARGFGLVDPVIRFVAAPPVERRATARHPETESNLRMVYVAAAPRDVVMALQRHLTVRGLDVDCVTVVAEAIRHIFAAASGSDEATALLLCLPSGPYLAFFLHGQPEIVIDPPGNLDPEVAVDPEFLRDQVERGAVYFRQRFGGAEPTRLLLAPPGRDHGALAELLEESLGVPVERMMGDATAEAIVAMGAVFAGRAPGAIDLFERPPGASHHVREFAARVGTATAALGALATVAALWMVFQVGAFRLAVHDRNSAQASVDRALTQAAPVRAMAQERATHEDAAAALRALYAERSRLAGALAGVAEAAGGRLRFDSLSVAQSKTGWSTTIRGVVMGVPGSDAVRALNDFFEAVRRQPGVAGAELERFDYAHPNPGDSARSVAPTALTFVMNFSIDRLSSQGSGD